MSIPASPLDFEGIPITEDTHVPHPRDPMPSFERVGELLRQNPVPPLPPVEGDPGTFSHCGNPRPHAPHLHSFAMQEGRYDDVQCNGTPMRDGYVMPLHINKGLHQLRAFFDTARNEYKPFEQDEDEPPAIEPYITSQEVDAYIALLDKTLKELAELRQTAIDYSWSKDTTHWGA